ncbi:8250_t:CDS:2 [Diversispora eburnea]|uniref:8250_t:CDS:1 n=1 Tax=Diversispora eburnea TaxID=1213867 RepID=A0A9N9BQG0_9GLOM|nr:8250_t:CDS:2 [Diversispora eburnea]
MNDAMNANTLEKSNPSSRISARISDIGFLCISISDDTIVNTINGIAKQNTSIAIPIFSSLPSSLHSKIHPANITNKINKLKLKDTNVKTRTHPVGLNIVDRLIKAQYAASINSDVK